MDTKLQVNNVNYSVASALKTGTGKGKLHDKKILVVFGHPSNSSYSHALYQSTLKALLGIPARGNNTPAWFSAWRDGEQDSTAVLGSLSENDAAVYNATLSRVRVRNLATATFDPVLRFGYQQRMPVDDFISGSQADILWADHIIFIAPIWWNHVPSLLKGWFDRVLTPGFAYSFKGLVSQKLLTGRTASFIYTSQAPASYLRIIPNSPVRNLKKHILGLCGIKLNHQLQLGLMTTAKDTAQRREEFISKTYQQISELVH